jgi:transposase
MCLTTCQELNLDQGSKRSALRRHHALNPKPEAVTDPDFRSGNLFFDRDDLVQVKYEMLRRVREEGQTVSRAASSFGFSRPSYYETQAAFEREGLPGLIRQRPGPRRAHKLSTSIVQYLLEALTDDSSLNSTTLAEMVHERFGIRVHPRSVERALARQKKGARTRP